MHDAIPMIMGSNIGTSVTNTIVSLTQVSAALSYDSAQAGPGGAGMNITVLTHWVSSQPITATFK